MTAFTRLGAGLWTWEPWVALRCAEAQLLWLALYTTSAARRNAPGLWQGGIPVMAEASNLAPDAVVSSLDRLITQELVEYDPKYRVLRMCALPDPGEYPANGNGIRSWWTRFGTVPECGVRDAHVPTLRWILEEGARRGRKRGSSAVLSQDHERAWQETFATVHVPSSRRRGVRTLLNSDTSTHAQPSLFASPNGSSEGTYSQGRASGREHVDNSDSLHQSNEIRGPETVPGTVTATNRIQDLGSRISSGEGEGGRGARPVLALVPPYTGADVMTELVRGEWDRTHDRTHQDALSAMIPVWVAEGVTLADFAVLAEHSRMAHQKRNLRWLLGCDLAGEIHRAKLAVDWRDVTARNMADSMP